ncbi:hypothetical protein HO133_003186 [Letharia lupina]|uniref:Uncharacterized protein n=1 Tax=Letharia lupina TaxID=560253 RepID=A0A8H6CC72_9LECA|nr:uncharacterized protein HO133_003186 [Letharia lupina]KAF6220752.1 hypothetical protein HO133_003186 [Letharia lupina]
MALSSKIELASLGEAGNETPVSQSQETLTAAPFGTLTLVPPEIREQIYLDLIAAGSVRFLESSKAFHNEALDILHQKGVCRLEFNIFKPRDIFPSQQFSKPILNLEIRLDLTDFVLRVPQPSNTCINKFNEWLTQSMDCVDTSRGLLPPTHPTPRKCCKILLDCNPGFSGWIPKFTFDFMKSLTGFKALVLAVANDYPGERKRRMVERMYDPRPNPQRDMESAMHSKENEDTLHVYETAMKALEPTLGPAEWVSDEKGAHLEFHPRAHNFSTDDGRQL